MTGLYYRIELDSWECIVRLAKGRLRVGYSHTFGWRVGSSCDGNSRVGDLCVVNSRFRLARRWFAGLYDSRGVELL